MQKWRSVDLDMEHMAMDYCGHVHLDMKTNWQHGRRDWRDMDRLPSALSSPASNNYGSQLQEKVAKGYPIRIPRTWWDSTWNLLRPQGGVQLTSKKTIIKALHCLYSPSSFTNFLNLPIHIVMDNTGSFKYWYKDARDKKCWVWLLQSRLQYSNCNIPEPPNNEPSQPSTEDEEELEEEPSQGEEEHSQLDTSLTSTPGQSP